MKLTLSTHSEKRWSVGSSFITVQLRSEEQPSLLSVQTITFCSFILLVTILRQCFLWVTRHIWFSPFLSEPAKIHFFFSTGVLGRTMPDVFSVKKRVRVCRGLLFSSKEFGVKVSFGKLALQVYMFRLLDRPKHKKNAAELVCKALQTLLCYRIWAVSAKRAGDSAGSFEQLRICIRNGWKKAETAATGPVGCMNSDTAEMEVEIVPEIKASVEKLWFAVVHITIVTEDPSSTKSSSE